MPDDSKSQNVNVRQHQDRDNRSLEQFPKSVKRFSDKNCGSHSALMFSRRFAPLFWTQFFAAFNDNFVKTSLGFLILYMVAHEDQESLIALSGAVFILPFFLFSVTGGELADRFDKARLARFFKLIEIIPALIAAVALYYASITLMFIALFLFGTGSALFGPVKYAVVPEQIRQSDLPRANAWIEGATFIAILGGTILAAFAFGEGEGKRLAFPALIVIFALLSWGGSLLMPYHGPAKADLKIDANIIRATWRLCHEIAAEKRLLIVSLMVSWFWLVGAIMLASLTALTAQLGQYYPGFTFFLTVFAVCVAIGSGLAAWISAGRIVLLQSVIGTFICAAAIIDLSFVLMQLQPVSTVTNFAEFLVLPGVLHITVDLSLVAIAGAFLVVPGFAALQAWAAPSNRARIIAANNIINSALMAAGMALVALLQTSLMGAFKLELYQLMLGLGVLSLLAGLLMLIVLPTNPLRDFVSILFRAFFRLEIKGLEHLKTAGETPILAFNHVSFLDGLLAFAICDSLHMRPPAFAIHYDQARRWWVRPFLKLMNAFPMDPARPLAARSLIRAVAGGSPLVIFPEGRITVTGSLMKVYDGTAMVADRTGAMVVPIKIDGLERTPFSRLSGIQTKRKLFPKVRVTITKPVQLELDPNLKSRARRQAAANELYRIMSDLIFATSGKDGSLFEELSRAGTAYGLRHQAIEDPLRGAMNYGLMLTAVRLLARLFVKYSKGQKNIGLLLPNSNMAAVSFYALQSAGKVAALLNFSAGLANLQAACRAGTLQTIISSRAFLRQARLEELALALEKGGIRFLYLEDLAKEISLFAKIMARLRRLHPVTRGVKNHDAAAILFTSGSEGTPKGVVLTHANMLANAAQAAARVDFGKADKIFNILPMFHSFGLTAATVLPLSYGVPVYFYPSPLHYRVVPEVIYASNATIMFGTDTFLNGYARNAHPYDLRSIRYCFAGAEPVKASTRQLMMEKFGIRILEGYGVTEASPVIALNTPMYNKAGSVGKLMPGIEARLEAVDGVARGGRLFIRGPNIMQGYLRAENPGVLEPTADGWHDTGDIVDIDAQGFITILGRAKRFAKIGGEMISLSAVEAMAARAFPDALLGVVALPDAKKGERLVLVTEDESVTRPALLQCARHQGVPELFIPSKIIHAKLPLLATGKIDYLALKQLAEL